MGSGQSSARAVDAQETDTGTQLFGSWDKPVAEAYAKNASKKGKAVASKAANATGAALGSAIYMEAGAGVKPTGKKMSGQQKGAAVPQGGVHSKKGGEAWTLSESTKDSAKVTAAQQALKGKLSKPMSEKLAQGVTKTQGNTGRKRSAEAWTLSQSSKSPAKVDAARKGLEAKLSKPRKSSQGTSAKKAQVPKSAQRNYAGMKHSSQAGPQMPRGKTAVSSDSRHMKKSSGVVKNGGVVKKSKAVAGTASKMAGKAAEAAQEVATASKEAAAGAASAAQDPATAVKSAATAAKSAAVEAAKSAQKAVEHSGVMDSTAVAQASQVASKVSEVVKEAAHTVQGAMSVAVMQAGTAGASAEKGIRSTGAKTPMAAEKAKAAAAVVKSEVKKSAGKVAKKAPKAKKALKRMVSEIDAEDAKTEGLGRGKRQRRQVKAFEPKM